MGNARVSTLQPTRVHIHDLYRCHALRVHTRESAFKGDVLAMVTKSCSAGTDSRILRYAVYNYATMVGL